MIAVLSQLQQAYVSTNPEQNRLLVHEEYASLSDNSIEIGHKFSTDELLAIHANEQIAYGEALDAEESLLQDLSAKLRRRINDGHDVSEQLDDIENQICRVQ